MSCHVRDVLERPHREGPSSVRPAPVHPRHARARVRQALFALAMLGFLPASVGAEEVGRVGALEGRVLASRPGEAPRPLDCGDPVHAGERIQTDAGARVRIETSQGHELHLADSSRLVLRHRHAGELVHDLERGAARLRDASPRPRLMVATPGGTDALLSPDVEVVRIGPDVRICEWLEAGLASCRLVQSRGRSNWLDDATPRIPLGLDDVCGWKRGIRSLYSAADFAAAPPVSAAPPSSDFDSEIELDPACAGDDCGADPELPEMPDPLEPDGRVLTVAPPPPAIPPFPPIIN